MAPCLVDAAAHRLPSPALTRDSGSARLLSSKNHLRLAIAVCLIAALLAPRTAAAERPPPDLMTKLAATSAGFDSVRLHATYAIETRIETLDGDGRVTGV